ncbi:hypothetical protein [Deinococcus aquaedulcis]|uniref:hypothetical protein n=1 Tax=Deinococcus aquaedulcis TaxID=2840455 RepID=UPI001C82BBCE|nr:hypothetical protein [Deinococcus aquaedulcis]
MTAAMLLDIRRASFLIRSSIEAVQREQSLHLGALLQTLHCTENLSEALSALHTLQYTLRQYPDDRFIVAQSHLEVLAEALRVAQDDARQSPELLQQLLLKKGI